MYYNTVYYILFGFPLKHYKIKKFTSEAKKVSLEDESLITTIQDFSQLDREGQQKYSLGAVFTNCVFQQRKAEEKVLVPEVFWLSKKIAGLSGFICFQKMRKQTSVQASLRS